jgi:hypothetical protein
MTDEWLALVARDLGVDVEIDQRPLLAMAREVAHRVERKATPLTTFLIGVAIGSGSEARDIDALCARVTELAEEWESSRDAHGRPG